MKTLAIMYHDLVENGNFAASGFAGDDADIYKIDRKLFESHIEALAAENQIQPVSAFDLDKNSERPNVLITFDDGGRSAYSLTAEILERRGWRGHFFVATDFIGTPSFLSEDDIRDLDARGHVIGSHSASHPLRMASCSREEMSDEWRKSIGKLSDILGKPVKIASVPGGHFSKAVAETAAECGIEILFNSEPVSKTKFIGDCRIIGRYSIQHKTSPAEAVALARGDIAPRLSQFLLWNAKKSAKKLFGKSYLSVREKLLSKG